MTETCNRCGLPKSKHGIDQYSGRQVKCPVKRERKTAPPQEHHRSPSGDY